MDVWHLPAAHGVVSTGDHVIIGSGCGSRRSVRVVHRCRRCRRHVSGSRVMQRTQLVQGSMSSSPVVCG